MRVADIGIGARGSVLSGPLRIGPLTPADNSNAYLEPSFLAKLDLTDAAASDDDAFLLAKTTTTLPNASTVTFTPDGVAGVSAVAHPRNVVVTVTHASSVVACNGVITGYNRNGTLITEAWSVTATGTSKTFTGKKAFKRVTSITVIAASNAQTNTVKIGTGNVFGLEFSTECPSAVKEVVDGALVTTGTIVAASTVSTEDSVGTYAPSTAPNGAHDYLVWTIVKNTTLD